MADWDDLFRASYGGLSLDVLDIDVELSRVIAKYKYPRKDGANTEDMGRDARIDAVTLAFFGEGHLRRLATFVQVAGKGRVETWVNPLTGSFQARVEHLRFRADASSRDWIVVSATFIEHSTDIAAFDVAESGNLAAGVEEVRVAGAALDAAIAAHLAGQTSTASAGALETVGRWANAADLAATRIELELGAITARIDAEVNRLEVANNPNAYPVYESFIALHDRVARAAGAAIEKTPQLVEHVVSAAAPLLAICQDLYGGAAAEAAFGRILKLNRLRTPAHVPVGTRLIVESPEA